MDITILKSKIGTLFNEISRRVFQTSTMFGIIVLLFAGAFADTTNVTPAFASLYITLFLVPHDVFIIICLLCGILLVVFDEPDWWILFFCTSPITLFISKLLFITISSKTIILSPPAYIVYTSWQLFVWLIIVLAARKKIR